MLIAAIWGTNGMNAVVKPKPEGSRAPPRTLTVKPIQREFALDLGMFDARGFPIPGSYKYPRWSLDADREHYLNKCINDGWDVAPAFDTRNEHGNVPRGSGGWATDSGEEYWH